MCTSKYPYIQHSFRLSVDEEQRLGFAILKKYGAVRGSTLKAFHEAVIDWIKKVEESV